MHITVPDSSLSDTSSVESSGDRLAACQSVGLPLSANATARPRVPVNTRRAPPCLINTRRTVQCFWRYPPVTPGKRLVLSWSVNARARWASEWGGWLTPGLPVSETGYTIKWIGFWRLWNLATQKKRLCELDRKHPSVKPTENISYLHYWLVEKTSAKITMLQ